VTVLSAAAIGAQEASFETEEPGLGDVDEKAQCLENIESEQPGKVDEIDSEALPPFE
jgi:hypothetical protein